MKTCSIAYVMFVTASIGGLFTLSQFLFRFLSDVTGVAAIIAHGMSIALFFHLITKCSGLKYEWRIAIGTVVPTLLYVIYYCSIYNQYAQPVFLVFSTFKFLTSCAIAEL